MFKIDDNVVYKRNVCKIDNIKKYNEKEYYVLIPVNDNSLIIDVPIDNNSIRNIISKSKALDIINNIHNVEIIKCANDKLLEFEYKSLLAEGSHESLIKIIKTTYIRNKERVENKRKIGEKDDQYFKKAESLLYTEFSISLNMSYDEVKSFIASRVEENLNNK